MSIPSLFISIAPRLTRRKVPQAVPVPDRGSHTYLAMRIIRYNEQWPRVLVNCKQHYCRSFASSMSPGVCRTRRQPAYWEHHFLHAAACWMRSSVVKSFVVAAMAMCFSQCALASSNPMELNGGSCVAMAGKNCVALAVDRRFGLEGQLVSTDAKRVLKINGQLLCGFTGLCTDIMTLMQDLSFEIALKRFGDEGQKMAPAAFAGLLSTMLYSRRSSPLFVEPVIAGLDGKGQPYLCGQDILGATVVADDFIVAGTSAQSLYGTCETFFRRGMDREELFETASRCFLSALERDCLSGYGAVVHLVTRDGIESRELNTRMD